MSRIEEDVVMQDLIPKVPSTIPQVPKPVDAREVRRREVRHELLEQEKKTQERKKVEEPNKGQTQHVPFRSNNLPPLKRHSEMEVLCSIMVT